MATIMNSYGDGQGKSGQGQDGGGGQAAGSSRNATGFYCSTSGTTFSDQTDLKEHYKSALHRYNLKRKVAGLPPVTKEWFEARREQLSTTANVAPVARQWMDPLTKKKFGSEQTYTTFVNSKKYQDLVRKSGKPAPDVIIIVKKEDEEDVASTSGIRNDAAPPAVAKPSGFKVFKPSGGLPLIIQANDGSGPMEQDKPESKHEDGEDSGWETASEVDEEEVVDSSKWEQWDLRRSLFDNHISRDFESNLEYMFKKFGFYFPDAEYLHDPEGLLRYLGTKLQYGRVALYTSGDDDNVKQYPSLHAVQRHMVDTNQCKMFYEGGEDEYADYYDYENEAAGGDESEGKVLAIGSEDIAAAQVVGGFELYLPNTDGSTGGKTLGTREFARYYRQKHSPVDERQSVVINTVRDRYRAMGIAVVDQQKSLTTKKLITKDAHQLKWEGKRNVKTAEWSNFVKQLGKGIGRMW